jgi:hypothetical protein
MAVNLFGCPTSIAEEFDHYQCSFSKRDNEHAFYMGCLTMLCMCQERTTDQQKALARELDRFMKDNGCQCDECRQRIADGTMPSLVEIIFGRTTQ